MDGRGLQTLQSRHGFGITVLNLFICPILHINCTSPSSLPRNPSSDGPFHPSPNSQLSVVSNRRNAISLDVREVKGICNPSQDTWVRLGLVEGGRGGTSFMFALAGPLAYNVSDTNMREGDVEGVDGSRVRHDGNTGDIVEQWCGDIQSK